MPINSLKNSPDLKKADAQLPLPRGRVGRVYASENPLPPCFQNRRDYMTELLVRPIELIGAALPQALTEIAYHLTGYAYEMTERKDKRISSKNYAGTRRPDDGRRDHRAL